MTDPPRSRRHTWWIFVIILLIASGVFWALGRSDGGAESSDPTIATPTPYVAEPDQIENTMETETDLPDPGQITPADEQEPAPIEPAEGN